MRSETLTMRRVLACILVLLASWRLGAQSTLTVVSSFDWQTGTLALRLRSSVDLDAANAPAQLFEAQRRMEREFPQLLFAGVLPLAIDSTRIVEDAITATPRLAARIAELSDRAGRGVAIPSPTLDAVEVEYRVPLFPDVVELFVTHRTPFRFERLIEWVPSRPFSGIVIYAVDPLPLRGTGERVLLRPALLPEIFDTDFRPVLRQAMVDPAAIARWGVVAYTEDTDPDLWRDRVGSDPMLVMARQAFGIEPTDVVIAPDDADRLLSLPENRELLRQGRILIILARGQSTVVGTGDAAALDSRDGSR